MRFSQRQGLTPVRTVIQTDGIDEGLRNRLWNVAQTQFKSDAYESGRNYLGNDPQIQKLFEHVWNKFFKLPIDTVGESYSDALRRLRDFFFKCEWYVVYDLIEFLTESIGDHFLERAVIGDYNEVLKEEMSAFRFVGGRIAQITSEEEVASIEQALALPDPLNAVTTHLRQALTLLADKKAPDYRNSIKESISAVESLSKLLSGLPGATLGPALDAVDKHASLHPSLKEAFKKLYGYTSDAQGIRHALMDEATLDLEDAKFMLVSCSAFVNYMVVKAQKAGINV